MPDNGAERLAWLDTLAAQLIAHNEPEVRDAARLQFVCLTDHKEIEYVALLCLSLSRKRRAEQRINSHRGVPRETK